jgi:branched-chain amino acid transport system substrate-binding protein
MSNANSKARWKRLATVSLSVSVAMSMLAACGGDDGASGSGDEGYPIGFVGSLSGPLAPVGTAMLGGVELAINDANENGGVNGRQIKLITEDDEADPSAGVTATRSLLSHDVLMVTGGNISTVVEGVLPTIERQKVAFLAQAASPSILDPVREAMFQIDQTSSSNAQPMVEFATELLKKQDFSVGIGPVESPAGAAWGDNVEKLASDKGFTITSRVTLPVSPGDITAQAQRLIDGTPDILLLQAPDGVLVALAQKIRDLGFSGPIANFSYGAATTTLEKIGDKDLYVLRTAAQYDTESTEPGTQKFVKLVNAAGDKKVAKSATQYTQGYLIGLMVVKALEQCGEDCDRAGLIAALNDIKVETDGFTPNPLSFTSKDHLATKSGSFYSFDGKSIKPALGGKAFAGTVYTLDAELPAS